MLRRNYISTLLLVLALLLLAVGITACGKVYEYLGLSKETTAELVADDAARTTVVVREVRDIFWECIYAGLALVGGAVSGYLGVKLQTSNGISTAMIRVIEDTNAEGLKKNIAAEAKRLSVADALHKQVKKVTRK